MIALVGRKELKMIKDWRIALVCGMILFVIAGLGNHFIDGM